MNKEHKTLSFKDAMHIKILIEEVASYHNLTEKGALQNLISIYDRVMKDNFFGELDNNDLLYYEACNLIRQTLHTVKELT